MARKKAANGAAEQGRVRVGGRAARTEDEVCTVRVYLTAVDPETNKPLANNVTRTLYIAESTVSEAADTISDAF